jgi:hypothetical protein
LAQMNAWFSVYGRDPVHDPSWAIGQAVLALDGEAVATWHHVSKQLAMQDRAVDTWDHFVSVMVKQYSVVSAGHNVRLRLKRLKQTGSVAAYHDAFRTIMADALDLPVGGAEAVFAFKEGLSPRLQSLLATDPQGRQESADLEAIVTIAKELDSAARLSAGAENKGDEWTAAGRKTKKRKAAGATGPERLGGPNGAPGGAPAKGVRVPPDVIAERKQRKACFKCGLMGHMAGTCTRGWRLDAPTGGPAKTTTPTGAT